MKLFRQKYRYLILMVSIHVLIFCGLSFGQESTVIFDCADIGLEARRILANLNEERLMIEGRRQALEKRENELKIMEMEVDTKLKRLTELREELEKLFEQKEELEQEKVKKLSMIYQKRDPAEAADNLATMDKDLAVSILSRMRDKAAGKILDQMDKTKAVEYSTSLGRLND